MVDRKARDELVTAVEAYVDEQSTAFQFDEQISDVVKRTDDVTVQKVAFALWFHYDDCTDHKVSMSKPEWDFYQRLLLLLHSDMEWHERTRRVWTWRQTAAGMAFVGFLAVAFWTGFGPHLFVVSIPFGLLSMVLSYGSVASTQPPEDDKQRFVPFRSFAELRAARYAQASFRKRGFPPQIANRRVRSPLINWIYTIQSWATWLLFAPVALLFQTIPELEGEAWVEATQPPSDQINRGLVPSS